MEERILDFKVHQPQLEELPGLYRGGVKRFKVHKNEGSPAFLMGGSSHVLNSKSLFIPAIHKTPSPKYFSDYRELKKEIWREKNFIITARSPVKAALNDPTSNKMLELASHAAFRQPVYTKLRPKVVNSNPITGYMNSTSKSPSSSRVLAQSGARMLGY